MVVSDASPLMNLAIIGRLEILQDFYGTIHVPEAVWRELVVQGKGKPGSKSISSASWIQKHAVRNQHFVTALREHLDPGESEAIGLALELEADLVLIDEAEGRRIAERYLLQKTGVMGVLLRAKNRGMIPSLSAEMEELRKKRISGLTNRFTKECFKPRVNKLQILEDFMIRETTLFYEMA